MQRLSLFALWRREFSHYSAGKFRQDLLAGLTVAAVALPLALAFGVASGATAAAGLITAILSGFIIGALSGAPYQISGPTGAMSAVLIVITHTSGSKASGLPASSPASSSWSSACCAWGALSPSSPHR